MRNKLSENIKQLMIETETDTQKLATYLGVTVQSVNRWKSGSVADMGLSTLIKLCEYFGCSVDYIVGKTERDIKPSNFMLENFGKQIRKVMQLKNISTYIMRKQTHFTSRNFHDWDKGADPKLSTLIELANYFRCSLDELVGLE